MEPLFNLASFARQRRNVQSAIQNPKSEIELEWEEPRDIRRVVVECAGDAPDLAWLRVEYWQRNWPQVDPESLDGTRRAWIGQDDPFHGQWIEARGACAREGNTLTFDFDPLDALELPDVRDLEQRPDYLARYRRTLKIRVITETSQVSKTWEVLSIRAYSTARETPFDITMRLVGRVANSPYNVTAYVGRVANSPYNVTAYNGAVGQVSNLPNGLRVTGVATDAPLGSRDCTLLTFRCDPTTLNPQLSTPDFTLNLADLRTGPLWIRDLGVYITDAANDVPFEAYKAQCEAAPRQPIFERVESEPEQTYARAVAEIPELDIARHPPYGFYAVLSAEANQQKFALRYNGEVFTGKGLAKLNNRILERIRWPGREIHWRIGTGDPPDFRERNGAQQQWCEEGYLPIIHTAWQDRDIACEQVAFATHVSDTSKVSDTLDASTADSVLMMTVNARNTTTAPRRACIWLQVSPDEHLTVDGDGNVLAHGRVQAAEYSPAMMKLAPYDAPVLRAHLTPSPSPERRGESSEVSWKSGDDIGRVLPSPSRRGAGGEVHASTLASPSATYHNAILFERWLEPGESVSLDIRIPFISYAEATDWQRIAALNMQRARADVTAYWRGHLARGAGLHLPAGERDLEDFTRAVPAHIWISATRDPVTRHIVLPPGTFWYGACGNEAAWQTVGLDCWGYHDRARDYLESLMAVQGSVKPDGDFQSAEGALQAIDFDQGRVKPSHFYYNLDHGTILEGILFHYRITGDQDWLRKFAPNVVAACDFITRERAATHDRDARTKGLLPPGHLEDNPEWRYWFAVNGHAYGGMKLSADALAEIGHPDADRIREAANAYRADILAAVREARIAAPVVRLLNGLAVPHVPARAELRGREYGWIREVSYGAIHLWDGGLFEHDAPEVTWILQDLEDNGFVNREYGFGINVDDDWFSQGGVTSQPNLMSIDLTYLRRDQVKHSLRNFYNNLVYGLYRDMRVLAEWMSEPGLGGGPFYKPSDEARVVTWLRHHLVTEEPPTPTCSELEDWTLWLGKGVPRAWHADGESFGVTNLPTFFGHVTYSVTSFLAAQGELRAQVKLDLRRLPYEIKLRLRHPAGRPMRQATVNGQPAQVDADKECVMLPAELRAEYVVVAQYE